MITEKKSFSVKPIHFNRIPKKFFGIVLKAAKYSEMDEEVVANSSSMSETGGNKAVAALATTSNSNLANGAEMRTAAESTEKATAKTHKSTSKSTNMAPKESLLNGQAKAKIENRADDDDDEEKSQGLRRRVYK